MTTERRRSNDKEMDDLRADFHSCSASVTAAVDRLAHQVGELKHAMNYNDNAGLQEMLKDFRDQKGFVAKSEQYGQRLVWGGKIFAWFAGISLTIGGVIAAIAHYMQNGVWPSGAP